MPISQMMFANKVCVVDIVQVWQMGPKWWGSRIGKSIPQIVAVHTLQKLEKFTLEKKWWGSRHGKGILQIVAGILLHTFDKKSLWKSGGGPAFPTTFRKSLEPSPTTFWHLPHVETSDKTLGVKDAESPSICEQIPPIAEVMLTLFAMWSENEAI